MATHLEITPRAVEKHINNLKKTKKIIRVGPNRGGHWKVIKK